MQTTTSSTSLFHRVQGMTLVLPTLALLAATPARAAEKIWTGAVNSNWDKTTANWTPSTFADNDLARFNGSATVTLTQNLTCNSMRPYSAVTINGANTLTFLGELRPMNPNVNLRINVPIAMGGNITAQFFNGANSTITLAGNITGSSWVVPTPNGTLILSGDNSGWSGNMAPEGDGTLHVGSAKATGTGTWDLLFDSLTVAVLDGSYVIPNKLSLRPRANGFRELRTSGSQAVSFTGNVELERFTANSGFGIRTALNAPATFSKVISDTGSSGNYVNLTKLGTGTLTFTGNNTYKGTTTVTTGTLVIDGNQSAATGNVTVGAGARLGGTGSIGGSVSIPSGATLAVEIDGATADDLTITGTLTLAGNLHIAHVGAPTQTEYLVATASSINITGATVTGETGWTPELRNGNTQLWIKGAPKGTMIMFR